MALTQTTSLDVVGGTQSITFFLANVPVDQITYSNNSITYATSNSYNLTKSDLLLYFQYLNVFYNILFVNFPIVNASVNNAWPLCIFDITASNIGVKKIVYNQTSIGVTVMNINYVPIATAAAFAARSSPVTLTNQEFFQNVYMLQQFINQVIVN